MTSSDTPEYALYDGDQLITRHLWDLATAEYERGASDLDIRPIAAEES